MKVLTAAQMREVDRGTIAMGIPGLVLMENAGHRVVEFLTERFAPLEGEPCEMFHAKHLRAGAKPGGERAGFAGGSMKKGKKN